MKREVYIWDNNVYLVEVDTETDEEAQEEAMKVYRAGEAKPLMDDVEVSCVVTPKIERETEPEEEKTE